MRNELLHKRITIGVYFLLICAIIGIWISEINQFNEVLENMWPPKNRYDYGNVIYSLKLTSPFSATIFSLILGIGVLLKNQFGWVLITSWFYFVCANFIKIVFEESFDNITEPFQSILLVTIPIGSIILMNTYKGIISYHKIGAKNKLKLNAWSIVLGIVLAVLLILKKNLLEQYPL